MKTKNIPAARKIYRSRFHQLLFAANETVSSPAANNEELYRAWIRSIGGTNDQDLRRRLEWDGLEPAGAWQRLAVPAAADVLQEKLLEQLANRLRQSPAFYPSPEHGPAEKTLFGELWEIVAAHVATELWNEPFLRDHALLTEAACNDLQSVLKTRLAELAGTALYHEFNRSRDLPATMLFIAGSASSDVTPGRSLYFSFLEQLRKDGMVSFFATYPVLAEYISVAIRSWKETTLEMLGRITDHMHRLIPVFELPADARIISIAQNLGDPHSGGRSVAIISFASPGSEKIHKVVYKPRGMRMEARYHEAVKRIPVPAGDIPLRWLRVIAAEDFGFVEFVQRVELHADPELQQFYRNAGRLLAFLHLMGCTDCHFENLVAAGNQLVLIDTETLLEGRIPLTQSDPDQRVTATKKLSGKMNGSVIRTGLLPHWAFWGNSQVATDVSALGIEPPKDQVQRAPGWMHINTDQMFLGTVESRPEPLAPSPLPAGQPNRLNDFIEDFCEGFGAQMEAFMQVKEEWAGEGGIIDSFFGIERRIVLRSTRIYHALKMQLLEPGSLTSHYQQGFVLEQLARAFLRYEKRPKYWPVFRCETEAMSRLDIPLFTIKCDAVDLVLWDGSTAENYLEQSGTELSRAKFNELDHRQVSFQLDVIRGLVGARRLSINTFSPAVPALKESRPRLQPAARLRECKRIADELLKTAVREENLPFWMAVDLGADSDKLCYGVLGPSLYSGHLGIALFLGAFGQALGQGGDHYRSESAKVLKEYLANLESSEDRDFLMRWWRDVNPGLSGSGGSLLALHLFAQQHPQLATEINGLVASLVDALTFDRVRADTQLDVMSGVAGLIGALLMTGSKRSLELAKTAGDRLVETQEAGGGWRVGNGKILTGFSHGAAGIVAALSRLYAATGIERYAAAAEKGLRFERSVYDPQAKNWPDLRHERGLRFAISWCHGAPGIALSRLCLAGSPLWDAKMRDELEAALGSTAAMSNNNDNLCCGLFGRSMILRIAADVLGEQAWEEQARKVEAGGYSFAASNKGEYRCFAAAGSDIRKPGLFTGTAGIGFSLLQPLTGERTLVTILSAGLLQPGNRK